LACVADAFVRTLPAAAVLAALLTVLGGATGCSSAANAEDLQVGDCLKFGGTVDRPEATKVLCGSKDSNFKVIAKVDDTGKCPLDADSSYSQRSSFSSSSAAVCMDIDWVVGGCMSVDPQHGRDPSRADCGNASVPNKQRATQILSGVASVDQCASGVGYAYDQRRFTVCVENMA
jgi:hypothetical protein